MTQKVTKPRRVQARRTKNYKAVHRPTRWGNPFPVEEHGRDEAMRLYRAWLNKRLAEDPYFLEPLRGFNLGCFCSPEVACHADIILEKLYGQSAP
ncbi:MAG: DUF4326 domain-containing protein [Planctomycetes bacterium]|nr:DUF4326 domain-containing protein [Planctomycetota bacterium]